MDTDPSSDVLRSVRLRGSVFYYVSFGDEWAAETPGSRQLAAALMPGAEHVLAYHMLLRGSGWAACDGEAPVRLQQGDIVLFPRGDGHVISKAPGMHALPDRRFATRHLAKPIPVVYHRGVLRPDVLTPAHEAAAVVICGFIGRDMTPFNPLIGALPRLLHQPANGGLDAWLAPVLDRAVLESQRGRAGGAAVLERVSETVLVDLAARVGTEIGRSSWQQVDQPLIDAFCRGDSRPLLPACRPGARGHDTLRAHDRPRPADPVAHTGDGL